MTTHTLVASRRTLFGKGTKKLRTAKKIPAVVYGKGAATVAIELPLAGFTRLWQTVGESTIVTIELKGGEVIPTIIQDVQLDPLTGAVIHADLHRVNMNEPIETEITLTLTGEAPAAKNLGGVLVRTIDHLRVKALPGDLVHDIAVPIDQLANFEDMIRVKDLVVPPKLTVLADPDEVVVKVSAPRSEAELKALEEAVTEDVAGVEKVEEKVPEEAEPVEVGAAETEAADVTKKEKEK